MVNRYHNVEHSLLQGDKEKDHRQERQDTPRHTLKMKDRKSKETKQAGGHLSAKIRKAHLRECLQGESCTHSAATVTASL